MTLFSVLLLVTSFQPDSCRINFEKWAIANTQNFSHDYLVQLNGFRQSVGCSMAMDSLPAAFEAKKVLDSIKADQWRRNDTAIDWDSWFSLNNLKFNESEINDLRFRLKNGAKSHEFYAQVKILQEEKDKKIEHMKRKSFAHLAISIANSDSLKFIHIKPHCEMKSWDSTATHWVECKNQPSFLGIYYDTIHTLRKRADIRKVSSLFFQYLISEDSFGIAEARKPKDASIAVVGFGCGWNYVASLAIFYADTEYIIEFDEANLNMEHSSGANFVREYYTPEFYAKLLRLFKTRQIKSNGCNS